MNSQDKYQIVEHLLRENVSLGPLHVGQEEPSHETRRDQFNKILTGDPALFLEKWGNQLPEYLLKHFECFKGTAAITLLKF